MVITKIIVIVGLTEKRQLQRVLLFLAFCHILKKTYIVEHPWVAVSIGFHIYFVYSSLLDNKISESESLLADVIFFGGVGGGGGGLAIIASFLL